MESAPVQEYPPWQTMSEYLVTDAAGIVTTETTVVFLPQTYLGPSIPLNSLFTYGGFTLPATIVTGYATETPDTTSTATPSFTTAPIPTTAIPTPIPSSSSSLSTFVPSSSSTHTTSTAPTPAPTTTPASAEGLTRGQLVGVIVASILGLIFLFVFILAMWLWCKGRRNRRDSQFYSVTPFGQESTYDFVEREEGAEFDRMMARALGHRSPGEGSPRHSGEERDSLLAASRGQPAAMYHTATEMGSRPGVPRVPPPSNSQSSSGTRTSGTNSGYGEVVERPLYSLPRMSEEGNYFGAGYDLTEDERRQVEDESVLPRDQDDDYDGYTGARAIPMGPSTPPRLDPENAFGSDIVQLPAPPLIQPRIRDSVASYPSIGDAEDATLLTVRRVQVNSESEGTSGFLTSLRLPVLPALANIGRLSWFNQEGPSRNSPRQSPTFDAVPLSDNDVEIGRAFLRQQQPDSVGRVSERPYSHQSNTSASGNTIWHDAFSSIPGTPQLTMPPRAITPADVILPEQRDWLTGSPTLLSSRPPAYEDPFADPRSSSPVQSQTVDILDLPAPAALTHFASNTSIPESDGVSSVGLSKYPYPPGLEGGAKVKTWSPDGSLIGATSPAWNAMNQRYSEMGEYRQRQTVDLLEERPPSAQEGWRNMAASNIGGGFGDAGARTTFGMPQIMHPALVASEQGSLHSMRSHLDPNYMRSTGSAAAARRELSGSVSSNSSRPSVNSSSSSATNSINRNIVRAGSIINDRGRRQDSHAPHPLSPFGVSGSFPSAAPAAVAGAVPKFKPGQVPTIDGSAPSASSVGLSVGIPSMPSSTLSSPGASTIRTIASGSTAVQGGRSRTISALTYGSPVQPEEEPPLPFTNPVLAKDWTSADGH